MKLKTTENGLLPTRQIMVHAVILRLWLGLYGTDRVHAW
jgi:hypothetical protein